MVSIKQRSEVKVKVTFFTAFTWALNYRFTDNQVKG